MALTSNYLVRLVDGGTTSVLIGAGQALSNILDTGGASIAAIQIPTTLDAATLTYRVQYKANMPFKNLCDSQVALIQHAVTGQEHIGELSNIFAGVNQVQVMSSVAQTNDTYIEFVMGPLWQ